MKVLNQNTGKEHNINQETFDLWSKAKIPLKIIEVEKPKAIVDKELKKGEKDLLEVAK